MLGGASARVSVDHTDSAPAMAPWFVRFGDRVIKATVPDGPRNQLVAGS